LEIEMRAHPYLVAVFLVSMMHPGLAREAFVAQLISKSAGGAFSGQGISGIANNASAVASPLPLSAVKAATAAAPTATPMNASYIAQQGVNNSAIVTQTGGHNLSSIVQVGTGNQAIVTQRH